MSQHLDALAKANHVRMERARLKRLVAAGDLTVTEVLLEHAESVVTMPIGELLSAQNRWGSTRTAKFMGRLGFSPFKQIGSLTERQRGLVVEALGEPRQVAA